MLIEYLLDLRLLHGGIPSPGTHRASVGGRGAAGWEGTTPMVWKPTKIATAGKTKELTRITLRWRGFFSTEALVTGTLDDGEGGRDRICHIL